MINPAVIQAELKGPGALALRPASQVMDLERLGSLHQSRLSFMRTLVRRIMRERWSIDAVRLELDSDGYGTVVYRIQTPTSLYSFVLFSSYLAPEDRNDRVIATQWDLTMALCEGEVDDAYVEQLRQNVPKQEAGRVDARVFVLSRANRSARNFDYVVDQLAKGEQPDVKRITQVGYLYRTTAVYGSGKLGMADWQKVAARHSDFARPFAAEMFTCFMLRNFSLTQAEHIARARAPEQAVAMQPQIKRYFGIGNSTGLGMAPYLINHPLLINRWIEMRELALARIRTFGVPGPERLTRFKALAVRAHQHTREIVTEDDWQTGKNGEVVADLAALQHYLGEHEPRDWNSLIAWAEQHCSLQGQEMVNSILFEVYPDLVDELEDHTGVTEHQDLAPGMSVAELRALIEERYRWALDIDFEAPRATETFWYRSQEKQEPRLGGSELDCGRARQMPLGIGLQVAQCYRSLCDYAAQYPEHSCAYFLFQKPEYRGIVRRIQSLRHCVYGDIQANLLDQDVLPMHLLRCKLAFFGVSKFDPRSRLWVRNTMFQGAPLLDDIGQPFDDDWFLPLTPAIDTEETR